MSELKIEVTDGSIKDVLIKDVPGEVAFVFEEVIRMNAEWDAKSSQEAFTKAVLDLLESRQFDQGIVDMLVNEYRWNMQISRRKKTP